MAKKKLDVPEKLKDLEQVTTMIGFLDRFGLKGFTFVYNYVQFKECDSSHFEATGCNTIDERMLVMEPYGTHTVMFIDDDLNPWTFELTLEESEIKKVLQNHWGKFSPMTIYSPGVQIRDIKQVTKLITDFSKVQTDQEILRLIRRKNPYAADFVESKRIEPSFYCMAPQIEQLFKIGVAFVNEMRYKRFSIGSKETRFKKSEVEAFNRLTQRGTNPKEIFKTSKIVYNGMKYESDLLAWDAVRKMEKNGKINADTIRLIVTTGYDVKDLSMVNSILGKKYRGKFIFTMDSLINYLNRIDMNEAIDRKEGLQLLLDYLRSCEVLDVEPRIDGDSLKREHDVMARNVRQHRDVIIAEKMAAKCDQLQKYNYSESIFFARAIASFDDLIDEANQQHNCVASYARLIAESRTMIFVVRMKANPDRSYITLELDPKTLGIRQKYVAYNQPVRNRAASEFISRFQKHCISVRDGKASNATPMVV